MHKKGITMIEMITAVVVISIISISIFTLTYYTKNKRNDTLTSNALYTISEKSLEKLTKIDYDELSTLIGNDSYIKLNHSSCISLSSISDTDCDEIFTQSVDNVDVTNSNFYIYIYRYYDNNLEKIVKKSSEHKLYKNYIQDFYKNEELTPGKEDIIRIDVIVEFEESEVILNEIIKK